MIQLDITDPNYQDKLLLMEMLSTVKDPELGLNVVDLGLIYQVAISENKVNILMTLSTPACPAADYLKTAVELTASNTFKDYIIIVEITFEPEWNGDMISEAGRKELGW
ncbi:MAG: metal-sulfur cluster assembly factor [Mucilaginibacter sp.]|uniref:metal-sulfur cluster assembly factor n=1 Tax=Mucilaginibacter sp. TaxID=1882438 RepID=UPI0032671331